MARRCLVQLTNAGIDLSQLGLGNLVAQDEDDDTTHQYNSRGDNHIDTSSHSIFGDGGSQSFNDMSDSQPDDMNLQAQSLIAALSALVPQSQPPAEPPRPANIIAPAPPPITIDLTDEPDDETPATVKSVIDAETTPRTKDLAHSSTSTTGDQPQTLEPTTPANTAAQVTQL
jgi:hypothetical protein